MIRRMYAYLVLAAVAMFAAAPVLIARAPYETTMGLVQKIFYFHVPAAAVMFLSTAVCGVASAAYLFRRNRAADRLALAAAELTVVFGLIVLVTGPLWARKAWGVWWQWDARLTTTLLLWMIFVAYLLLRAYGGPGSDKLAAAVGIFGMMDVPIIYKSVDIWRTVHPKTTVVPTLSPEMRWPLWFCMAAFLMLYALMLAARTRLESQRAMLDELYLALDESRDTAGAGGGAR